ncbi:zinc finger protein Elbow [Chrysoperla carnea]|uniref:zinc finger protein Elbow n=1 Tax=Chrysoperla carnea TaxID=189513 RepID=UPI001D07EFE4|nr:zinc finger protein Elbow [Chrysoperla carnea]
MLTSSSAANQYLRPEYLTPLPTTLDAKKSPLALLAQTCSQIGADSPNTKLITSSEKTKSKQTNETLREKSSPASSNNSVSDLSIKSSSFKPYDLNSSSRDKSRSPEERTSSVNSRVRTPMSIKSSGNQSGRCASNQSASSPRTSPHLTQLGSRSKTPASNHSDSPHLSESTPKRAETSTPKSTESSSTVASSTRNGYAPSVYTSAADSAVQLGTAYKSGSLPPVTSSYLSYPTTNGLPLPIDLMTSSLMAAQHHHALKSLEYARLKNSVQPVCRDPYCTGCSLNSHFIATTTSAGGKPGGSCPAGCLQCDHAKTGSNASSYAAAYAHAQLAALAAASQLPYVCNWIAGDANYCGKRFGSSDELLQHLRTHTNLASLPESMLSAHSIPPPHPLLHRTYPTPPLSPLATARYHPYGKPSPLLPPSALASSPLAGFSLPPHPGLPPYFSPYSLYGPRLGATPGMHP